MPSKVSVCIANYKDDPFLCEAIKSVGMQNYKDIEICVYNDSVGIGTGMAFNKAIEMATGDIIFLLCSDDVITDIHVLSDVVECFEHILEIGHVSRFYHQFVENDRHPVRAWRGEDIIELANNPSGMAFRREAIYGIGLTNKMFVEVSSLVNDVIKRGWAFSILRYDTVAVRIHKSISRTPSYYVRNWTTSPVEEWAKLGWKSTDYTSLIQIAVNFNRKAVWNEIRSFIHCDYRNLFNIAFWFFSGLALLTPRVILYRLPEIYRATIGRWTTREVKRGE